MKTLASLLLLLVSCFANANTDVAPPILLNQSFVIPADLTSLKGSLLSSFVFSFTSYDDIQGQTLKVQVREDVPSFYVDFVAGAAPKVRFDEGYPEDLKVISISTNEQGGYQVAINFWNILKYSYAHVQAQMIVGSDASYVVDFPNQLIPSANYSATLDLPTLHNSRTAKPMQEWLDLTFTELGLTDKMVVSFAVGLNRCVTQETCYVLPIVLVPSMEFNSEISDQLGQAVTSYMLAHDILDTDSIVFDLKVMKRQDDGSTLPIYSVSDLKIPAANLIIR